MRLFAGVWPPDEVTQRLAAMARPHAPGVRWTPPAQWHVTLAFLGEVAGEAVPELVAALADATARAAAPPVAVLGPRTCLLGRAVLCAPVAGLEALAALVAGALVPPGRPAPAPFRGHLTLARSGRRPMPAALAGVAVEARWRVEEVALVRSVLGAAGPRYSSLARATVGS